MKIDEFLQRAHAARQTGLVYWLGAGAGGLSSSGAPLAQPGTAIDLDANLAALRTARPEVFAEYDAGLRALEAKGTPRAALPKLACDCSGYVCWALGVRRDGHPGIGGLNTDAMVADAAGDRRLLVPLPLNRAVPGALLVHPRPGGASKAPGHVGIVTDVGADGRATRMLHCAPGNILIDPPPGLPRSAIAETDTRVFDETPSTVLLMWKAFQAA